MDQTFKELDIMERVIEVNYYEDVPHICQILTGFCLLKKKHTPRYKVNFHQDTGETIKGAYVKVRYKEKIIIYDTMDGYQDVSTMRQLLEQSDYYFKRSYSEGKNRIFFPEWSSKIYPLGFNYHVSCYKHPVDKAFSKEAIKSVLGIECNLYSNTFFSTRLFEKKPQKTHSIPVVMFVARLWEPDNSITDELLRERNSINAIRIGVIRELKKIKEIRFIGGLSDNAYTRKIAPDLILPERLTNRKNYIRCMQKTDICIATMGLHESTGWKMGEYISSSKAVLSEKLHYQVPGNFQKETNYLEFSTVNECVDALKRLILNRSQIDEMKQHNYAYYQKYLEPAKLIQNTLDIVDHV